jgi:Ulp1 family protease
LFDGWSNHTNELCSVPQQENGSDCGLFTWLFAAYSSMEGAFNFTQRDILLLHLFITYIVYQSGLKQLKLKPV